MSDDNTDLRQELEALADEWEDKAAKEPAAEWWTFKNCAQELREVIDDD